MGAIETAADIRRPAAGPSEQEVSEFWAAYRNSPAEAVWLGEALVERYPELNRVWVKLVHLRLSGGEPERALELAREALERFPEDPDLLRLMANAIEQRQGRIAALPWLRRLAETGKDRGLGYYRLGDYYLFTGDGREALRHFELAEQAGYASPRLAWARCRAAVFAGDSQLARSFLPQLSAPDATEAEGEIRRLETRRQALAEALGKGRLRSLTSSQLKAWAASRGVAPVRSGRKDLFISETGDLFGERMPGSRAAVLVFGGLKEMVGVSLPKFNRTLRTYGVSTLYISDPRRLLLLSGAPTFGTFEQTLEGLRDLLKAWGVNRIYCLGMSAGGYPGLLYGLELGAHRVLTMSGPTTLTGPVVEADGRARIVLGRILAEVSLDEFDLRKRLEAAENPPEVIAYYGADSPPDTRHALNLEGLPTVSLRPLDGEVGHNVSAALEARGQYTAVLAEFLADAA